MAEGLREVARLPDPVGQVVKMWTRPNGLMVGRMRIPIGVIGIIFESRPNVTADATGLCLKSGNSVLLRGGSEAFHSNQAIGRLLKEAMVRIGLPQEAVRSSPIPKGGDPGDAPTGGRNRPHHPQRRRRSHSVRCEPFEDSGDQAITKESAISSWMRMRIWRWPHKSASMPKSRDRVSVML